MHPRWAPYKTHCEIVGRARYGKTTLAVGHGHIHILAGNPMMWLEYKSQGYEKLVAFVAEANPNYPAKFLNLSNPDRLIAWNPFALPTGRDLATHANHLAEVILKVVSNQPISELQNYARVAEAFFAHLAVSKMPLTEALDMVEYDKRKLWLDYSKDMPDEQFREEMRRISYTDKSDWKFEVKPLRNRLRPFITSSMLRQVMSLPDPLEVGECFRNGVSLFVNATPSAHLPRETARICLGLLLSDITLVGIEHANDPHTTFLYADEAQEYSSPDLGSMLDLVLASGIRATIIHHFAGQMDERTKESLSVNAGIRVIFGGLSAEIRNKLAGDAFSRELAEDWHRQPRISHITEYEDDIGTSVTEYPDGDQITTHDRLRPQSVEVQTGWEDYSPEEKRAKFAEKLNLPKYQCMIVLPDRTYHYKVPPLRPYLYSSAETLLFRNNLPNSFPPHANSFERSTRDTPSRSKKRPARLFDAG
jgi:hypothetical protein